MPGTLTVVGDPIPPLNLKEIRKKGILESAKDKNGDFSVVYRHKDFVEIFSSRLCWGPLYFYYDDDTFLVAESLWEILKRDIEVRIDLQATKELAVFSTSLDCRTPLKNIHRFPQGSYGMFDGEELKVKRYWRYSHRAFHGEREAINHVDVALDKAVREATGFYEGYFGVGLSGGFDSRLVAAYLARYTRDVTGFIVGESKPRGLFLSRDHKNSRNIAKTLGMHHIEIGRERDFRWSLHRQAVHKPFSALRLNEPAFYPNFDVLATGFTGGELFGQALPPKIQWMKPQELCEAMMSRWSLLRKPQFWVRRMTGKILGRREPLLEEIEGVFEKKDCQILKGKIKKFIEENRQARDNVTVFQRFLLEQRQTLAKPLFRGPVFSPFRHPDFVEAVSKAKTELLINRYLEKKLLLTKFPALARVETQDYRPPLTGGSKVKSFIDYALRWHALRYRKWTLQNLKVCREILSKENSLFPFEAEAVMPLAKTFPRIFNNLVKMKYVFDMIMEQHA